MMKQPGEYTAREIASQPDAWRAAFDQMRAEEQRVRAFLTSTQHDAVVFTGCGSTYYLALAAAAVWQRVTGMAACAAPASEIWAAPDQIGIGRSPLLIAVSRSAETTETIRAVEAARAARQMQVMTLTCYAERALSTSGDLNLVFPSGQEDSVAQTRAFSVLYLAAIMVSAIAGAQPGLLDELHGLPERLRRLMNTYADTVRQLGRDRTVDRFYFLGTGFRYGLASELSLKMKEMALAHSEPFYTLEFRHGPKSMVTPQTLVVSLLSQERRAQELAVIADIAALGGRTLALGSAAPGIDFGPPLSDVADSLLYLPFGQLLAFERAISGGHDPDRPRHLDTVVRLDA
ncbi:MAG: SIS domain-containing protein [Candidatus Flexifilum sp.]|jgi:glucosamine--fructose-6-phosphate aminotransferase (isomerizing)